jgi:diguanylate cyclase (GGDEF)-like protein/PAS domain S-box-containing protein
MPELYLTPASISYLNQFLLSLLITGYFGYRFRDRDIFQRQNLGLTVFFLSVTVLSGLLFLENSLLPAQRLYIVYLQSAVLAVVMLSLLQFAYSFPLLSPNQAIERRVALFLFLAYALFETGYAVWRFSLLLSAGLVEFRIDWMDVGPVLGFLWVIFVFVRGAIQNWQVQASRYFALIFIIPFFLVLFNLLRTFGYIPATFYQISVSIGILLTIFLFALNYLTSLPARTSLLVKFSGVIVATMFIVLGSIAWLLVPAHARQYRPEIQQQTTFRFSPSMDGGYQVAELPFQYEIDLGEKLPLTDSPKLQPFVFVRDFNFEFFGIKHEAIMISGDGFIAFGEYSPRVLRDFEYHFSPMPVLMAVLLDFHPDISEGGVYLRRELDRLVLTYDRVPAYYYPEQLYTFQIILRADNTFDITYHTLPDLRYLSNDRPDSRLWAIGIKPGRADVEQSSLLATPFSIGPQGWMDDQYRAFRVYLHDFISPLAQAILLSSLLIVIGLPVLLKITLAQPIESLLAGARAWNKGKLGVQIPVKYNDEIGYLSESFNKLGTQLTSVLANLEMMVDERTRELSEANQQMRKLFIAVQQSPSAIVITDLEARIEYVNPAFEQSTGYELVEVLGKNPRILKSDRTPDAIYKEMWSVLKSGQTWRGELCNRRKDGQEFWEYTVIAPIRNDMDEITHYVAVKEDVTDRVLAEQALKESERQYRDLFNLESDAIFIIRNTDGRILEANEAASSMYGYSLEELQQISNIDLSAEPEETKRATKANMSIDKIVTIPLRMHRRKSGEIFPVDITARFITWKGQSVHIAAIRDVSERYQKDLDLKRMVITDSLTNVFNRRYFFSEGRKIFQRARLQSGTLAVLMMDIDHFKFINDTYGHSVGDEVLFQFAARVKNILRPNDLLARYGGEEFIAMFTDTRREETCQIAGRILSAISGSTFDIDNHKITITLSIGIALLDDVIDDLEIQVDQADKALYQAKQAGRNCWRIAAQG